jgi:hypothetical protein
MIGRRPYAAFGNSIGDRQMLEWTGAGAGARLKMLVLHDDATREYAYGPAAGLPDSKVGTFTPALYLPRLGGDPCSNHAMALGLQFSAMPLPLSSFIAFSFLGRCDNPMPRRTFGALVNWMLS